MKKLLITTAAALAILYIGCTETKKIDYHEPLACFLATRAVEPLDNTVWMAVGTDEFRRMLLFKDGSVNLFYGLIEDGEMQRWSEYYSAPYVLLDDATGAVTELVYPIFGEKEMTQHLSVTKAEQGYLLVSEMDTYEFVGGYSTDLDERWTLVYTTIQPWGEE